jgi:diguanylate cyclase (GGDEF)-like protein/PAS domain S-box-containing protein
MDTHGRVTMPHFTDPEIYRDILDELQIGVSVLDLHSKIVFWSDGAEEITGYARIEVLGHSCSENILLHCNHTGCEMCLEHCPLTEALHGAKPAETMGSIHHKSGHWTPVHIWAIPLRDRNGSIIGIIQTFESEFAVNGPNPNDRSMKERGCIDYATELPNQTIMHSHLRESLATFAELQIPLGVLCLEVKELEQFRARYGVEAANSILRALSRTLRNSVWSTDFVGRWSGNRFLVILSGCDQKALQAASARIRKMTAKLTIQWWGEELSAAALVSSTNALVGDSVETLMQRALEPLDHSERAQSQAGAAAAG